MNLAKANFYQITVETIASNSVVCLKYSGIWLGTKQVNKNASGSQQHNFYIWKESGGSSKVCIVYIQNLFSVRLQGANIFAIPIR